MKLKGEFDPKALYSVGDAVAFGGHVYALQKEAPEGTFPVSTMFWGKVDQVVEQCALMILDGLSCGGGCEPIKLANNLSTTKAGMGLDARQGKALKNLIDDLTARVAKLEKN